MKSLLAFPVVVALVVLSFSCNKGQAASEDNAMAEWVNNLRDGGIAKSGFVKVYGSETFAGKAEGYQLWRGSYRGIPIALYSCMFQYNTIFQIEHPSEYPKDSLGVKFIRVLLVVEENASGNAASQPVGKSGKASRVPVAVKEFTSAQIDPGRFVADPKTDPSGVAIGAAKITVKDNGNGVLAFQFNATKKQEWDSFNLEDALKGRNMTGEKKIVTPSFPDYTPEQFAEAVTKAFSELKFQDDIERSYDNFPTGKAEEIVAHPMWNNPDAMKALLKKANEKELVFVLNVMMTIDNDFDPWYLSRLASISPEIMELANNESVYVRNGFRDVFKNTFWPKDLKVLESWLNSKYPELIEIALGVFKAKKYTPSNIERVRELAKSPDDAIKMSAELLLKSIRTNK
ncbi:MAG: hypothetical protein HZA50_02595 [Planctomycetes bacterium]|nr:hypothetical protein [Planctomycetota bacterium]